MPYEASFAPLPAPCAAHYRTPAGVMAQAVASDEYTTDDVRAARRARDSSVATRSDPTTPTRSDARCALCCSTCCLWTRWLRGSRLRWTWRRRGRAEGWTRLSQWHGSSHTAATSCPSRPALPSFCSSSTRRAQTPLARAQQQRCSRRSARPWRRREHMPVPTCCALCAQRAASSAIQFARRACAALADFCPPAARFAPSALRVHWLFG